MRRVREGGFTLIEIIMIIVVAAIAIPVLLIMMGQHAQLGVSPELSVTASNLGQALMEEIKSKGYAGAGAYGGFSDNPSLGGVQYSRMVSVCNVPSSNLNDTSACSATTGYLRVEVTVSHPKFGSANLVTLLTNF